jgi:hypothetical protein
LRPLLIICLSFLSYNITAQKVKGEELEPSNLKLQNVLLMASKDSISFQFVESFANSLSILFDEHDIDLSTMMVEEYDSIAFNRALQTGINSIIYITPKATRANFNIDNGNRVLGLIFRIKILYRKEKDVNIFVWEGTIDFNIYKWSNQHGLKSASNFYPKVCDPQT